MASTRPGPLGEDILLARHGDRIKRLRQDRRHGWTVAELRGGGVDVAPNHLDGGTVHLSPVERAQLGVAALASRKDPATRRELRMLGRVVLVCTVLSIAVYGLLVWGTVTTMEPEQIEMMMSGPMAYLPAGDPAAAGAAEPALPSAGS